MIWDAASFEAAYWIIKLAQDLRGLVVLQAQKGRNHTIKKKKKENQNMCFVLKRQFFRV